VLINIPCARLEHNHLDTAWTDTGGQIEIGVGSSLRCMRLRGTTGLPQVK
jgi:hypothetical protein